MSTTKAHLCCTNPQQRIDSPEPPSRPLASVDRIFAAAALPEDHPHAIKFPDRKAEFDVSIIRSPNIVNKIKLQFRRRSTKNLSKDKEYDEDAHCLTSQEVLPDLQHELEGVPALAEVHPIPHERFGSVGEVQETPPGKTIRPEVRTSVLRSLGYLRPLLQKPSDLTVSGDSYNIVEVTTRVAARQEVGDVAICNDRPLPALPRSFSTPTLLHDEMGPTTRPRRSFSEPRIGDQIDIPKLRGMAKSGSLSRSGSQTKSELTLPEAAHGHARTPTLHVQEPTMTDSEDDTPHFTAESEQQSDEEDVHLHTMDISHQLRTLSQLSDVPEDELLFSANQPWNFHVKERSDFKDTSRRSRHSRQESSAGVESTTIPSSWERVRSPPILDTTSSVYSRSATASPRLVDQTSTERDLAPYEVPQDLNALFADWPLKPSASAEETQQALETVSTRSANSERRNKPLPPTPLDSRKDSGTESFVTAINKDEMSSVRFLTPGRASPAPSKKSTSTVSKASKTSKFKERFSPQKEAVRKRRSIFKFLRPGSRKQQARSISSPALMARKPVTGVDGSLDDPALLTVQYELADEPRNGYRSRSMSNFDPRYSDAASYLTAPSTLQRRPTMAEYERNLSVVGDDRRRPYAVNITRAKEIQEDDRRDSNPLRRALSRATPLKDDASPLMGKALEKHQEEKALFRSASKQRDSLKSSPRTPTFNSSPFTGTPLSLTLDEQSELLDPLERGDIGRPSARSLSAVHLVPPGKATAHSSIRGSPSAITGASSTKSDINQSISPPVAGRRPTRIGTSLDSWSRYPSHTREERCGSAGRSDNVITRDFAVDVNHEDINVTDEVDVGSPESKRTGKSSGKQSKASLGKSRSMTLSNIVRYYSNLFHTNGFTGQNRRTSITTGGKLEYPELEMLPPQMPADSPRSHHRLSHLKEEVQKDAEIIQKYVKDEETKLEKFVRKEEDDFEDFVKTEEAKLEGFVRKEEDQFESFVKKEEGKLKEYIQEEEDKIMHHHRHSSGSRSPFRHGSIFGGSPHQQSRRRDTMIAPNDDLEAAAQADGSADDQLRLDGIVSIKPDSSPFMTSKAQLWSDVYKECLGRPSFADEQASKRLLSDDDEATRAMPPPALKPVKARSPEQLKRLDPNATIRRFPSVTIIDDRKGHLRSVSLISVKTSRSAGLERASTQDLLELVRAREREACEKLLKDVGGDGLGAARDVC